MSTKTAKAPKKPSKASSHPPYNDMIVAAMKQGSTRKGLSKNAISKYIKENYSISDSVHDSQTKLSLKRLLDSGKLVKVKGLGLAGSFKFSKTFMEGEGKKKTSSAKKTTKKPATTTTTTGTAATTAKAKKPPSTKKPATPKKTSPKKTAPAKPKKDAPKKKPTPTKAAAKPKTKKPPAKKAKTPKKAAPKKKK